MRDAQRVNEIDFLRFFAAMIVVLFHYAFRGYAADGMSTMPYLWLAPVAKYGWLGVELFFLISGFVILMTASEGSLKKFVISRLVRLYPAFWVCCTFTFVMILLIGGHQYSATFPQYLVNMTMLNEFVRVPAIDGVYWSLTTEMRFYFLVALVLLFKQIHRVELFLVFWLVASAGLELFPVGKLRFIFIVQYSPYFIGGATCFLIYAKGLSLRRGFTLIGTLGMSIYQTLFKLQWMEQHYQIHFDRAIIIGMVVAFYAVMFLVSTKRTGPLGEKKWGLIGALTYPLYLIHQNVGFMLFNALYPTYNAHLVLWGTIGLMIFIAYLVYAKIERVYSKSFKKALEFISSPENFRFKARASSPP